VLGGWLFAASAATNAVHVLRIMSVQTAMNRARVAQFMPKKGPGALKKVKKTEKSCLLFGTFVVEYPCEQPQTKLQDSRPVRHSPRL
jgi:hypothetical protein